MEVSKPKRIVLKLSGESLKGKLEFGLDSEIIKAIATEIKKISKLLTNAESNCNQRCKLSAGYGFNLPTFVSPPSPSH